MGVLVNPKFAVRQQNSTDIVNAKANLSYIKRTITPGEQQVMAVPCNWNMPGESYLNRSPSLGRKKREWKQSR